MYVLHFRSVFTMGCRFIFVQSVSDGSPSAMQKVLGSASVPVSRLEAFKRERRFDSVRWDFANETVDPHAIGLAIKSSV
jgi:hypothetical protein